MSTAHPVAEVLLGLDGRLGPTLADRCDVCGEDYDTVGTTQRCRERHTARLTPAQRELHGRGITPTPEARKALTKAKRLGKAGRLDEAREVLADLPRHRWEGLDVARLETKNCPRCTGVVLAGYEDDRIAGTLVVDPYRLDPGEEQAAVILGRATWRLWGMAGQWRAIRRTPRPEATPLPPASAHVVVVADHACGTSLSTTALAVGIVRPTYDEVPPW